MLYLKKKCYIFLKNAIYFKKILFSPFTSSKSLLYNIKKHKKPTLDVLVAN